jgi:AraC family transcriptional regulator
MLILETGIYLGQVLDMTQAEGILAGATSYREGDATGLMHYHENPHLSFVLQGGGLEKRKGFEFERLPGQVMFFHSGESHQCINKLFPAKNVNLEIEPVFLQNNAVTESAINTAISKNPNAKFNMLKVYKELLTGDGFSGSSIKMLLLNLVYSNPKIEADHAHPVWIDTVYDLLHDRWSEQLTLKDLAEAASVHPITISKYFPKYFSCTFGEYMRKLKIEKALELIKSSALSLTEIAYDCGFSDQSHFTRTFKQLTGFLPHHYKKL